MVVAPDPITRPAGGLILTGVGAEAVVVVVVAVVVVEYAEEALEGVALGVVVGTLAEIGVVGSGAGEVVCGGWAAGAATTLRLSILMLMVGMLLLFVVLFCNVSFGGIV